MSSRTDALYNTLQVDLKDHLNDYQFRAMRAGSSLWPDAASVQEVASAQLVSKIFSKLTVRGKVTDVACTAALEKFIAINNRCEFFSFTPNDSKDELLIGTLKDVLQEFFYPNSEPLLGSFEEVISCGGVGPGASVSARGNDLYTKIFDGPLSYTEENLLIPWEFTVSQDDRWFQALVCSYQAGHIPRAVEGSKLSFVRKNDKTARTICTEPTINMWLQLGIGHLITKRLKSYFGIDLSRQQEVNKAMAFEASVGADYCTIDLESASDSISMPLLEAILPPQVFAWLRSTRSPTTRLPDGDLVSLNMVSTNGNGFTFPLQTAIFAACLKSVYETLDEPFNKTKVRRPVKVTPILWDYIPTRKRELPGETELGTFAVFGDDIVCSKRSYALVVKLLHMCGFKVNAQKSFSQGLFYESCGGDYWNGCYVRPFYVKSLDTRQDLYKAINGLNRWSAIHGISLVNTVQLILSWLKCTGLMVPLGEADDAGLQVPLIMASKSSKVTKVLPGSYSYSCCVPQKGYLLIKEDVITCGRGERSRGYNPDGLWLSFLFGCVRGYRINLRQRETRYRTERRYVPSWDRLSPLHRSLGIGERRLIDAILSNLLV
jgi:hypothetical protein